MTGRPLDAGKLSPRPRITPIPKAYAIMCRSAAQRDYQGNKDETEETKDLDAGSDYLRFPETACQLVKSPRPTFSR